MTPKLISLQGGQHAPLADDEQLPGELIKLSSVPGNALAVAADSGLYVAQPQVPSSSGAVAVVTYTMSGAQSFTANARAVLNPTFATTTLQLANTTDGITNASSVAEANKPYAGAITGTGFVIKEFVGSVKQANIFDIIGTVDPQASGNTSVNLVYEVQSIASGATVASGAILFNGQPTDPFISNIPFSIRVSTVSDAPSLANGYVIFLTPYGTAYNVNISRVRRITPA